MVSSVAPTPTSVPIQPPTAPQIIITAPAANTPYRSGTEVVIESTLIGSPTDTIRVDLLVDRQIVRTDQFSMKDNLTQIPLAHIWKATTPGAHVIVVRATNQAGVTGEAALTITINEPPKPTNTPTKPPAAPQIIITAPAANTPYRSGTEVVIESTLIGSPTDTIRVDLLVNGQIVRTDQFSMKDNLTQIPLAHIWKATTPGAYTLTVLATSTYGTHQATLVLTVIGTSAATPARTATRTISAAPTKTKTPSPSATARIASPYDIFIPTPTAPSMTYPIDFQSSLQVVTYPVTGRTFDEINASLERNPIANPNEEGFRVGLAESYTRTQWYSRTSLRGCEVDSGTVTVAITITLPALKTTTGVPASVLNRWNTYVRDVSNHEQTHARLYLEGYRMLQSDLGNIPPAPNCDVLKTQVQALLKRNKESINRVNDEFDSKYGRIKFP